MAPNTRRFGAADKRVALHSVLTSAYSCLCVLKMQSCALQAVGSRLATSYSRWVQGAAVPAGKVTVLA